MCISIIRVQKNSLRTEALETIQKISGNYFSNTDLYKFEK